MPLFLFIFTLVLAVVYIIFIIFDNRNQWDSERLIHIFLPTLLCLLLIALCFYACSYAIMRHKAINNCENLISDYYEGCVFVDKFEEENGKKKFIYNEKVYEVTIDLGTVATKWNYKDIDYTITIIEPDGTENVITPKEKSEIKNGGK